MMIILICALMLFSSLSLNYIMNKLPVKVISENRQKNLFYNNRRIIDVQEKVFYFSCVYSAILVAAVLLGNYDIYNYIPFLLMIIPMIVFTVFIVIYYSKTDIEIGIIANEDGYFVDEDEFYDLLGYKNPNDRRIFVPDPVNTMSMGINRGNKKGKIIFSLSNLILVFTLIVVMFVGAPATYNIKTDGNKFEIGTILYKDSVEYDKIESIKLLDKFPEGRTIRTNGTSTEYQHYGNFRIEGIGSVRLYIYEDTSSVIEIKRKGDRPIFVNEKTKDKTNELYGKLLNKVNKK